MRNNPELEMPQKPVPDEMGSGPEFYNVDFSLQTQLRIATGAPPPPAPGQFQLHVVEDLLYPSIYKL